MKLIERVGGFVVEFPCGDKLETRQQTEAAAWEWVAKYCYNVAIRVSREPINSHHRFLEAEAQIASQNKQAVLTLNNQTEELVRNHANRLL